VIVLYLGRVMEVGPARSLIGAPKHPYTEALISAVPEPDPDRARRRIVPQGDLPSPINPPSGSVCRTRCRMRSPASAEKLPRYARSAEATQKPASMTTSNKRRQGGLDFIMTVCFG
jgi:peptide/nickel transport system ATP-binding protein